MESKKAVYNMEARILLVEDDRAIVENLSAYLKGEGFRVTAVDGQRKAMEKLGQEPFDLVLLDVTLAEGNGYSVCTAMKATYDIPIIFLTALGDEFSVVTGLEMGADDYISKPFRPRELVARMRSSLRRTRKAGGPVRVGDLKVDMERGVLMRGEQELFLSALEYRLFLGFSRTGEGCCPGISF